MNRPLFPTVGSNPDEQRLRSGLNELLALVLDSGVIPTRLAIERPLVSAAPGGAPIALAWGVLNRVALQASGVHPVALPRIAPSTMGVPLVASFRCATGATARVVAMPPARVNQSATGLLVASGVTLQAITDGVDWVVF